MKQLSEHDEAVLNSIFNPLLPLGEVTYSEEREDDEDDGEEPFDPEVASIVKKAILATEEKNFDEAFKLFERAIQRAPNSPSILNDRAQALRLADRVEDAMNDLNLAVQLSGGKGKAGIQALCQRGILHRANDKVDEARADFTEAAKRGSSFARTQLVELNPYAAMCNQMLREITVKLNDPSVN